MKSIPGVEVLTDEIKVGIGKPITMVFANVKIKKIKFNRRNPNVMDGKTFDGLSKNVDNMGFPEFPVLFFDSKYRELLCIDGEHRIISVKKKGYKKCPAGIILKGISRVEAYSGAYSFNKFKGQIDGLKLAQMIQYGLHEWGEKEVMEFFQLQKYQIDEQLMHLQDNKDTAKTIRDRTSDFQKINSDVIRNQSKELRSIPVMDMEMTLMMSVPRKRYDYIIETLKMVKENDNVESLYRICKYYRKHKSKL